MDNVIRSHIEQIQIASRQNRLVVFVGAGVSANSGVPTWRALIDSFKKELPEQISEETDYLKIAQLYRELRGEKEYLDKVKNVLEYEKVSPNKIHKEILELNPCHIVTTNYDDLIELSALAYNHQYYVVREDKNLPANKGEKMIIKMHGDFNIGNIVLTENDYFDYSSNFPLIKSYVVSLFATKLVLFVGFSFNDINLKYILRNVQNVLGERMQRAYLLTDKKYDNLISEYYKSKGICLIDNLDENRKDLSVGEKIQFQLHDINCYDKYGDDIIALTISFLDEYGDQIAYLGKYLQFIIPPKKRDGFSIALGCVDLPRTYSKHLKKILKTKEQIKTIYHLYGNRIYDLFVFLLDNQINRVQNIKIDTKLHLHLYNKSKVDAISEYFYELNLVKISELIKIMRKSPIGYTKNDLQLPFALYKIGNYEEAYNLFKNLAPEFWKRRKYYLYFICLYNIRILIWLLIRDKIFEPLHETENLKKEFAELDLQKILNDLPLETSLKSILYKVLDYSVVKDILLEVSKLQEDLEKQKESAKAGGSSLNSNVLKLLYDYRQSFDFCNENYLVYDIYTESKDVYKKIAKGIIDSVMTPVGKNGLQSKLDILTEDILPLFIFQLDPNDLREILSKHADKELPIDDGFRIKMTRLVVNLASSLVSIRGNNYKILPQELVAKYLKNIITLCLYIENPPVLNSIYELVANVWDEGRFMFDTKILVAFMKKQNLSAECAMQIINKILISNKSTSTNVLIDISEFVSDLSNIIKTEGKILNSIGSVDQIKCQDYVFYTASFINAVNSELQDDIVQYVRANASCLQDLVIAELRTGVAFITPDLIKKISNKIHHAKYKYYDGYICLNLISIVENSRKDLQSSLTEISETNDCVRFFINPLLFNDYSDVDALWLKFCEDNILKELLKKEQIKVIAKQYIMDSPYDEFFKKRFFDLV